MQANAELSPVLRRCSVFGKGAELEGARSADPVLLLLNCRFGRFSYHIQRETYRSPRREIRAPSTRTPIRWFDVIAPLCLS